MSTRTETIRQIARTERLLIEIAREHEISEGLRRLAEAFDKLAKDQPLQSEEAIDQIEGDKIRAQQ